MHTLIASLRAAENSLITYLVRVFFFTEPEWLLLSSIEFIVVQAFMVSGVVITRYNKHASAAVSDILQCSNLEFTDICNIDLQIKTPHP